MLHTFGFAMKESHLVHRVIPIYFETGRSPPCQHQWKIISRAEPLTTSMLPGTRSISSIWRMHYPSWDQRRSGDSFSHPGGATETERGSSNLRGAKRSQCLPPTTGWMSPWPPSCLHCPLSTPRLKLTVPSYHSLATGKVAWTGLA